MATTYGERLLAEAEDRMRAVRRRRRTIVLLAPALAILAAATWRTMTIRQASLDEAGPVRLVLDHGATLGYAVLLVGFPLVLALGARLHALAAWVAIATGPVLMPIVFGPGWRWWQRVLLVAACAIVIAARRSQPRPTSARRPRGRRR